jgi:hypothetical protein
MATFLDVTLLGHFSVIFTFLLVFVIMYGILEFGKILGDNKGIHSIMALCVAFLLLVYKPALDIITIAIPWFVIMFIIILFILINFALFNQSHEGFAEMLKGRGRIGTWIVAVSIIIVIYAMSQVFGQNVGPYLGSEANVTTVNGEPGSTSTGSFNDNLGATFFHPKILGLIAMLLIGTFTVAFLARKSSS